MKLSTAIRLMDVRHPISPAWKLCRKKLFKNKKFSTNNIKAKIIIIIRSLEKDSNFGYETVGISDILEKLRRLLITH